MAELEKELADIRREVIESRNLVIRTDNQLKTLHAEVKGVGRRLEEAQRRQRLASAVAYGIFALLAVGAGLAVSSVRAALAAHEQERLSRELGEARAALDLWKSRAAAGEVASEEAARATELLDAGTAADRRSAISALARIDQGRLSPLERSAIQELLARARREAGVEAIDHALKASRRGEPGAAVDELSAFLALDPPDPEALEASFLLGAALARTGRPAEAIPLLTRVVERERRVRTREEALALLALAYEQTGRPERAVEIARAALEASPASPWAPSFRARLTAARRLPAADAGSPPSGDAGASR
ncbi:MAG TPA: tetratricopeptide repeat protein [Myxococcaceae bacterium]|jgi:tetratricopeptide (TPR) repeat protein|nr:tetratricopeptide repeat protein [Myxococcaceae bacterium]